MYFAIDDGAVSNAIFSVKLGPFVPKPHQGDKLVLFVRKPEDLAFIGTSEVLQVRDREERHDDGVTVNREVTISATREFDELSTRFHKFVSEFS